MVVRAAKVGRGVGVGGEGTGAAGSGTESDDQVRVQAARHSKSEGRWPAKQSDKRRYVV